MQLIMEKPASHMLPGAAPVAAETALAAARVKATATATAGWRRCIQRRPLPLWLLRQLQLAPRLCNLCFQIVMPASVKMPNLRQQLHRQGRQLPIAALAVQMAASEVAAAAAIHRAAPAATTQRALLAPPTVPTVAAGAMMKMRAAAARMSRLGAATMMPGWHRLRPLGGAWQQREPA